LRRGAALLALLFLVAGCGSSKRVANLVFVSTRDGDYALYGLSGGREWRLTKEKGDPSSPRGLFFQDQPAWSPDGNSIAFVSRRDGRSHIYVSRADGTDTVRLTSGAADDSRPAWSPDGREIALARSGQLWIVPFFGGNARRVTHRLGGDAADPAWSPDGKLIAYDYRPAGYSIREIWVARADGSDQRQVTRLREISALPTWSPKGDRIAFQSNVHGRHFEIYSSALDGSGLKRETNSSIDTIDPAWSPSGETIAFSRDGAIWTVDRTGHETKLTSGGNDSSPAWLPAGHAAG
jgi:Tol biopolymer transport system component